MQSNYEERGSWVSNVRKGLLCTVTFFLKKKKMKKMEKMKKKVFTNYSTLTEAVVVVTAIRRPLSE